MPDKKSLSRLTRSLLVGSSAGAIALQVGCVPVPTQPVSGAQAGAPTSAIRIDNQAEAQLCQRALNSRSAQDATQLMISFPASRCIAPLLNAMAPAQLAAIPSQAVQGLDASVLRLLTPATRSRLATNPGVGPQQAQSTAQTVLQTGFRGPNNVY